MNITDEDVNWYMQERFLSKSMIEIYTLVKPFFDQKYVDYASFIKSKKDFANLDGAIAEFKSAYLILLFLNSCNRAVEQSGGRYKRPEWLVRTPATDMLERKTKGVKIIKQTGSNHPDIVFKYNRGIVNVEVKNLTQEDTRKNKSFNLTDTPVISDPNLQLFSSEALSRKEHDFVLQFVTGLIQKASSQFVSRREAGIIKEGDTNVSFIVAKHLYPMHGETPLLTAAYHGVQERTLVKIDPVENIQSRVLQYKYYDSITKSNGAEINLEDIKTSTINAGLAGVVMIFPSLTKIDVQISCINNNEFLVDFYMYLNSLKGVDCEIQHWHIYS